MGKGGRRLEDLHLDQSHRDLIEENLDDFIRYKNGQKVEEPPSAAIQSDKNAESSLRASETPNELDVSSTIEAPIDEPNLAPLRIGEPSKKGNPLIQNSLPIDFELQLVVKGITTNRLLNELEPALEKHISSQYQSMVDNESSAPSTLRLGGVDLTLQLVDSSWWEGGRSRSRRIQEESNTKLMTIGVNGSVKYSMEVDGSLPTPDEIEERWTQAYLDITSEEELRRAIADARIEGVLKLQQVERSQEPIDRSNNDSPNGATGNQDPGATQNGDISSLYVGDNTNDGVNPNGEPTGDGETGASTTESTSKKTTELERPSTLSIIFGFILTGIAILGLFGYAYLFYRKRRKRLKKKQKMKESITFSSANLSAGAAGATPRIRQNSLYASKAISQSTPYSTPIPNTSQMQIHSMVLSQSESGETSYRGLESSVGSEDISDSFANELKLAASRDQEAWDEFQRRKESHEQREAARLEALKGYVGKNREPPAFLLSRAPNRSEDDDGNGAIETDLEGRTSWAKSYPYGDESRETRVAHSNEVKKSPRSLAWEPYSSSLLPTEEKKDETNATEFFAQKLKDIENNMDESGRQRLDISQSRSDENASTSDILSEVSELSKYVRRYERRKDRKHKREEYLHERLSVSGGSSYSPTSNAMQPGNSPAVKKMSIGMDGRVYNTRTDIDTQRSTPSSTARLQPAPLSSYAESYKDAKKQDSIQQTLSFVSDDEEDPEDDSIRSQRLGISPYRVSYDNAYYQEGSTRKRDVVPSSSMTPVLSSRMQATPTKQDYKASVGYYNDPNKSSSSRLAHLRANDAIIDHSNSEVNVSYDISGSNAGKAPDEKKNSWSTINKSKAMARLNLRRSKKSENTATVVKVATPQLETKKPKVSRTSNKGFDKIRGLFEQKTNEQPEPIYPPGEHWQYAGSLGKESRNHY